MKKTILLLKIDVLLSGLICGGSALAFTSLDANSWNESAVRRVLHTFAYGGYATDAQIKSWSGMAPDIEDPDYHGNTTIEHTAWALTGMQIDKDPGAYGTTRTQDWWVAPIDYTDHFDATGRNLRNFTRHYAGDLEILHQPIGGAAGPGYCQ